MISPARGKKVNRVIYQREAKALSETSWMKSIHPKLKKKLIAVPVMMLLLKMMLLAV